MSIDRPFHGGLFAGDFLGESIVESDGWLAFDDGSLDGLEAALRRIFDRFPTGGSPNESQTEDDVRYIYSTFPIVERQETDAWRAYRSRDLSLAWMNALEAGWPDAE